MKYISLLLLAFFLISCGGNEETTEQQTNSSPANTTKKEEIKIEKQTQEEAIQEITDSITQKDISERIGTKSQSGSAVTVNAEYQNPIMTVNMAITYTLDEAGKISSLVFQNNYEGLDNYEEKLQVLIGKTLEEVETTDIEAPKAPWDLIAVNTIKAAIASTMQ